MTILCLNPITSDYNVKCYKGNALYLYNKKYPHFSLKKVLSLAIVNKMREHTLDSSAIIAVMSWSLMAGIILMSW